MLFRKTPPFYPYTSDRMEALRIAHNQTVYILSDSFFDHSIPHRRSDGPQIFGKALLEAVEISGFQRSDSLGYLLAARIDLTLTVPCFFSQICSRRFPVFLLEALYEMGLAAKREVVGSLSIGNTCIQHGQRCIQFLIQNIAADRQSHLPMK